VKAAPEHGRALLRHWLKLRRLRGVSEAGSPARAGFTRAGVQAGAARRNPERSEGSGPMPAPVLCRWLKFNAVGAGGVLLQLATLALLKDGFGLHYLAATALAIEAALLHNFWWHERYTWADRKLNRSDAGSRLLRFHFANGAVTLLGNMLLMWLLVEAAGMHYLLANIVTIVACALVNFLLSDLLVFGEDLSRVD